MVKRQTRKKVRSSGSSSPKLGLKKLRSAFDHMEKVVKRLKPKAKHSFSDTVSEYRAEWQKVFKREISPADAAAYLKFRFGLKGSRAMTRRTSKMRGGALPLAGAPLDYSTKAGVNGVYGNFPSYQQEGLDRYYGSALTSDCGKPNEFPTDGSSASQVGGAWTDAFMRPIPSDAPPPSSAYTTMMNFKGTPPYPSADAVGAGAIRHVPASYVTKANITSIPRTFSGNGTSGDVYSRT